MRILLATLLFLTLLILLLARPVASESPAEPAERFVPSEEVSADNAVAFPVDI